MYKQCTQCKQPKDVSEFPRRGKSLRAACRSCTRAAFRDWYARVKIDPSKERVRVAKRLRNHGRKDKRYSNSDPYRRRARMALNYAVKSGVVIRPAACSACGWVCKPHGHHADYSKPLEVEWLCSICHGKRHQKDIGAIPGENQNQKGP